MIRKNEINPCPFGLLIPEGCSMAGSTVTGMKEGQKNKLINTGQKCTYNAQLNEELKFVNCNYGEATQGMGNFNPAHASPLYPRLWEGFNTINLDRQYHNYKDFSWFSLYGASSPSLSKRAAQHAPCKVCGILTEGETLYAHEGMCLGCFKGPEKGHDWLGQYEDSQGKIGRRLSCRDQKDRVIIAQAKVKQRIELNPRATWICPHCEDEIHEKSLFYDTKNIKGNGLGWYHRPCMGKGPIVLPSSFTSLLLYSEKENEKKEDKEKVPNPFRRNLDYGTRQGALMV